MRDGSFGVVGVNGGRLMTLRLLRALQIALQADAPTWGLCRHSGMVLAGIQIVYMIFKICSWWYSITIAQPFTCSDNDEFIILLMPTKEARRGNRSQNHHFD